MVEALQENALKLEGQIRHYKRQKVDKDGPRSHSSSAIARNPIVRAADGSPVRALRDSPVRPISAGIRKLRSESSEHSGGG